MIGAIPDLMIPLLFDASAIRTERSELVLVILVTLGDPSSVDSLGCVNPAHLTIQVLLLKWEKVPTKLAKITGNQWKPSPLQRLEVFGTVLQQHLQGLGHNHRGRAWPQPGDAQVASGSMNC